MRTVPVSKTSTFYVTGGTLPADANSYVERQADGDLFDSLVRGECCYVLNTRQMGKSSLMVRTAGRLREERFTRRRVAAQVVGITTANGRWRMHGGKS